uniref:Uncharacterized protein n=1 Tax=Ditylenchus dipsaci TaxID=166011 RepID=A0A915CW95_9BILA
MNLIRIQIFGVVSRRSSFVIFLVGIKSQKAETHACFFSLVIYCVLRKREAKRDALGTSLEKVKVVDSGSERKISTASTQSNSPRQPDLKEAKQSVVNVQGKPVGVRKVASEPIGKSSHQTGVGAKRRRAESQKEFEERKAALKKHILREAEKKKALKEYVLATLPIWKGKSKWNKPPKENTTKAGVAADKKNVILAKPSKMHPRLKESSHLSEAGKQGTDSCRNLLPSSQPAKEISNHPAVFVPASVNDVSSCSAKDVRCSSEAVVALEVESPSLESLVPVLSLYCDNKAVVAGSPACHGKDDHSSTSCSEVFKNSINSEEWNRIATKFWEKLNSPNTIDRLISLVFNAVAPTNTGSLHYNYKGGFSTVLLAICDADYKCVYADVGNYGKESDGGILIVRRVGLRQDAAIGNNEI